MLVYLQNQAFWADRLYLNKKIRDNTGFSHEYYMRKIILSRSHELYCNTNVYFVSILQDFITIAEIYNKFSMTQATIFAKKR